MNNGNQPQAYPQKPQNAPYVEKTTRQIGEEIRAQRKAQEAETKAQKAALKAQRKAEKEEAKAQKAQAMAPLKAQEAEAKSEKKAGKAEIRKEKRAEKARINLEKKAKEKAKRIATRYDAKLEFWSTDTQRQSMKSIGENRHCDLRGATAYLIEGNSSSRVTATRVLGGAVLGGGAGAVVGANAKKAKAGPVLVRVDLADGDYVEIKTNTDKLVQAQRFVNCVNGIGAS